MPSAEYRNWRTTQAAALDGIEAAHTAARGAGSARRSADRLLTHAYVVLLSAEFQGFCKELHRECGRHFASLVPVTIREVVFNQFLAQRLLDRGNPNPGNIGADFNRLGLKLFDLAERTDSRVEDWRKSLGELNDWRNAIAHQDFDPTKLGGTIPLRLGRVRGWRAACGRLARVFDAVLGRHLEATTGVKPW